MTKTPAVKKIYSKETIEYYYDDYMNLKHDNLLEDEKIKQLLDKNENKKKMSNLIFRRCKDESRELTDLEKQKILTLNAGAIHKVAYKYWSHNKAYLDYDDLFQAGYIGLMNSAKSYDVDNKSKASFFTYAYHSIRSEIVVQQNKHREMIRVPRTRKTENKYTFS